MKLCKHCGAHNSDERTVCVDCGERLGKPLSQQEEEQLRKIADEKMEKICRKTDPLQVNLLDKVMGGASAVGLVATFIRMLIATGEPTPFSAFWLCLVLFAWAGIASVVPGVLWALGRRRSWDDGNPGVWYNITRRGAVVVSVAVGFALLVLSWFPHVLEEILSFI